MKRFENILGIHEPALRVRTRRMDIIAQNLANSSTPQYKARDLDFRKLLADRQDEMTARTTHQRHEAHLLPWSAHGVVYRVPINAAADGNTVEAQVEQVRFGEAAGQYDATLRFLEKRVEGLRKALKGE
jgi:flagellar basal-body rod protein FlgB